MKPEGGKLFLAWSPVNQAWLTCFGDPSRGPATWSVADIDGQRIFRTIEEAKYSVNAVGLRLVKSGRFYVVAVREQYFLEVDGIIFCQHPQTSKPEFLLRVFGTDRVHCQQQSREEAEELLRNRPDTLEGVRIVTEHPQEDESLIDR